MKLAILLLILAAVTFVTITPFLFYIIEKDAGRNPWQELKRLLRISTATENHNAIPAEWKATLAGTFELPSLEVEHQYRKELTREFISETIFSFIMTIESPESLPKPSIKANTKTKDDLSALLKESAEILEFPRGRNISSDRFHPINWRKMGTAA